MSDVISDHLNLMKDDLYRKELKAYLDAFSKKETLKEERKDGEHTED